jgi:hypothetical protein
MFRHAGRSAHPSCVLALVATLALALVGSPASRAAEFDKLDSAVKDIPADASFYYSLMRNREQVEAVLSSKAWAKLMSLPALAHVKQLAQDKANPAAGPLQQFQEWAKDPENQQLGELLLDMVSNEIFVYGGSNVTEVSNTFGRVMSAAQMEGFRQAMDEQFTGEKAKSVDDTKAIRIILAELTKKPEALAVPEIILGFKVSKPEVAVAQLKRLEKLLPMVAEQFPDLKDRLKWVKVGDSEFLSLTIDAKLMKFDEQMIRKYEEKPGEYDPVVKRIQDMKITISLGVRGKHMLVAIAERTAAIAKLGTGKRLIDTPELKPLAKYADQSITDISYSSKAFRSRGGVSMLFSYDWPKLTAVVLESKQFVSLKPEAQERIRKDLTAFTKEVQAGEPKAGASLAFTFLSSRGKEGYAYDWSEHPRLDGAKPLSILDHVGGDPLIVTAGRSKYDPQDWPNLVRWAKVGFGYFEEYGVPAMKPEEQKQYQEVMKSALPLLKRFDEITGKTFLPSLADGQAAFVVDAKLSSKQWHNNLPPSPTPIVVPELALVIGVSDAAQLQKAMGEYRTLLNDVLAVIREKSPDNKIPITEIPAPQSRKVKGGTIFFYPLPEQLGLDKQLLPNAGVNEKVAVLTLSEGHSERLLTATPLKANGGPLADLKRPLAGAAFVNYAGLVDLLAGWAEAAANFVPDQGEVKVADVLEQARIVFDVLKVFRSYSSATYFQDGALVTHSEVVITDLK